MAAHLALHADRVEITRWWGTSQLFMPHAAGEAALAALAARQHRAVQLAHPDLVRFWCRDCDAVYCRACWRAHPPTFDDGFYDCTSADCPAGHTHVVDD